MSDLNSQIAEIEKVIAAGQFLQARKLIIRARFESSIPADKSALLELQKDCERAMQEQMDVACKAANQLAAAGDKDEAIAQYKIGLEVTETLGSAEAGEYRSKIADMLSDLYFSMAQINEARQYAALAGKVIRPAHGMESPAAIVILQSCGLLQELDNERISKLLEECNGSEPERFDTIHFLTGYYSFALSERGIQDGFLAHDWRFGQETDDVVAEFSALVSKEPILKLVAYPNGRSGGQLLLQRKNNKEFATEFSGCLDEIAAVFNSELKLTGDERRFVSLYTGGDFFAYYLFDPMTFNKVCKTNPPVLSAESVPGEESEDWRVPLTKV